jgi:hypothetical protein
MTLVAPGPPTDDVIDRRARHAELLSQQRRTPAFSARRVPGRRGNVTTPDRGDFYGRELGRSVQWSGCAPRSAFRYSVGDVGGVVSKEQMVGPHACANVAAVENVTPRGDRAVDSFPRHTMGEAGYPGLTDPSITAGVTHTHPQPTIPRLGDVTPESDFDGFGFHSRRIL